MTITEALAELKTVAKRIDAKKTFVKQYLVRPDNVKDPLEKDGGSYKVVTEALQAIADLEQRYVDLRLAIQKANETNTIKIEGDEKSIADWLVWRREILPQHRTFVRSLNGMLTNARSQLNSWRPNVPNEKPIELVANIDETKLAQMIEILEKVDGELDGLLSLKNATIMVEV